jgi:hypothetical protein
LMAPQKGIGVGEFVLDAHPFAGERARHHQQQSPEQNVDAERLELGFLAADQRSDEQTCSEPGGGDPEDADLYVPRASDGSVANSAGTSVRDR